MTERDSTFDLSRRKLLRTLAIAPTAGLSGASPVTTGYDTRPEVQAFVREMHEKHGLDADILLQLFRYANFQPGVIRAITPPRDLRIRSWQSYRPRYINDDRVVSGVRFRRRYARFFDMAQQRFAVPQEIIAAVIGVETLYGRMTGNFQTLSVLATLAFDYPPRAELFRRELEELLLLARETDRSAITFKGSYAGAIGLPQFLPSSYRRYALDFDGDGKIDLLESPGDAIGSVGNFLHEHGWRGGERIAVPARVPPRATLLADGDVAPKHTVSELAARGITAGITASEEIDGTEKCAVIDLVTPDKPTEYWLGFENFYVLTRYNRSSFYAMAVFQLAEALRGALAGAAIGK